VFFLKKRTKNFCHFAFAAFGFWRQARGAAKEILAAFSAYD
jgi:hypothetical protein